MKFLKLIGIGLLAIGLFGCGDSEEEKAVGGVPETTPEARNMELAARQSSKDSERSFDSRAEPEKSLNTPAELNPPSRKEEPGTKSVPTVKTRNVVPKNTTEASSAKDNWRPGESKAPERDSTVPIGSGKEVSPGRIPSPSLSQSAEEIQTPKEESREDSSVSAVQTIVVPPSPPRRSTTGPPEIPRAVVTVDAPKEPGFRTAVLPAGSVIEIRTAERISSKSNISGDTFEATLTGDLSVNGNAIVRRGSEVTGRLLEVSRPGKVKGRGSLTFDLREIRGDEAVYALKTNSITIQAESSKGKDAARVGAATAIGAVLGAVFGGKKGAAVGGATAGGAGAAGVLLSRGEDVEIPAERLFSFRLEEDVEIRFQ